MQDNINHNDKQEALAQQIERVEQLMIAVCRAKTTAERSRLQVILTQEREHLANMALEFAKENVIRT